MYRDIYAGVNKSVAYTGVKGIIEMIQKHGGWPLFVGCVKLYFFNQLTIKAVTSLPSISTAILTYTSQVVTVTRCLAKAATLLKAINSIVPKLAGYIKG